jgi:hypothetical protein
VLHPPDAAKICGLHGNGDVSSMHLEACLGQAASATKHNSQPPMLFPSAYLVAALACGPKWKGLTHLEFGPQNDAAILQVANEGRHIEGAVLAVTKLTHTVPE